MKKNRYSARAALALLIAFVLSIACACGSFGGKNEKPAPTQAPSAITGKEEKHGMIMLLVPDGMKVAAAYGTGDDTVFVVDEKDQTFKQICVNVVEPGAEGSVEAEIKAYKEHYSGEDSVTEAGGAIWTGVAYKLDGSADCFRVYGIVDSRTVYVYSISYAINSPEANAILGSLKINK